MGRQSMSLLRSLIGRSNAPCVHAPQRGKTWHLRHIQHTAGIYGFFACVALAASKEAGHDLCWWKTGAMCERRYRVGEQWYNLRPDALAEYRFGQQQVRDLSIKYTSYAHFIASREWARVLNTASACLHRS